MASSDTFLLLLALLFPPLPVWLKRGLCSVDSFVNIILSCLGWLPGVLHAWFVIYVTPDYDQYVIVEDAEAQQPRGAPKPRGYRAYYVFTQGDGGAPQWQRDGRWQGYGTIGTNTAQPSGSEPAPPAYDEAVRGDNKVQQP